MSNRLPYDWFRDSATSVMTRMIIISAVLHVLLLGGLAFWFSRHKAPEPKLINVALIAAPGPMTPMPGSAPAAPPPPPPDEFGPEQKTPPPPPEPPKPEQKPEPPKPKEEPKPEPKPEKPKPEPKPEKPPKPSTKEEKPKKQKPVELKPVEDPKDEPLKKTPQKTTGKPVPKTKGPTLVGAEPTDIVMPSDQPISMAVGSAGQGPPTAMGSWPGLLQRQVYMQWVVPNGIPMNDANYLPQITVTIGRDGKIIQGPTVTKPSPSDALNESCVYALMNATIPPFPDNYEEPSVTLVVQFSPMGRQAAMGGAMPQPSAPAF